VNTNQLHRWAAKYKHAEVAKRNDKGETLEEENRRIDNVPFEVCSALGYLEDGKAAYRIRLYRVPNVPCEWADDALSVELQGNRLGPEGVMPMLAYPTFGDGGAVAARRKSSPLAEVGDGTATLRLLQSEATVLLGQLRWQGDAGELEGQIEARVCPPR